jgi:hypothetical protein
MSFSSDIRNLNYSFSLKCNNDNTDEPMTSAISPLSALRLAKGKRTNKVHPKTGHEGPEVG